MIVTGIERQKRHHDRVNIYIDGEFAVGIHATVLVKHRLREGDEIDEQTLHAITSDEEVNLARQKAFRLLSYRMRSEHELRTRLREKEFQPEVITLVIDHLRTLGVIDDKAFAKSFVHDAQLRKPAGNRLLQQQLRRKGVSAAVIQEVLDERDNKEGEEDLALVAARNLLKRYQKSRKVPDYKKQQKRVADFLARRGFEWTIISSVLRTLFKQQTQSHEEA